MRSIHRATPLAACLWEKQTLRPLMVLTLEELLTYNISLLELKSRLTPAPDVAMVFTFPRAHVLGESGITAI